jgi:hypothetical protein
MTVGAANRVEGTSKSGRVVRDASLALDFVKGVVIAVAWGGATVALRGRARSV